MIQIKEVSKFDLDSPTLIEGFPGIGLVGTISTSYIAEKLHMEPLAYLVSDKFPPLAAVHNYVPLHPARIYKSKKHNLIVLFSEFTIPMNMIYPLTDTIIQWSKKNKVKQIYSLGGISIEEGDKEVFGIASTPDLQKLLKSHNVRMIKEGATTGVSGVLLAECASMGFPAVSLLSRAKPDLMDPIAASVVLDKIKEILGLDVDTSELLTEAKEIEGKIKQMMQSAKTAHNHYQVVQSLGPMYG